MADILGAEVDEEGFLVDLKDQIFRYNPLA
jgi:hypothetical protein